jgi:methylated-DNA-[protein]-cysteine S-methyltransferase
MESGIRSGLIMTVYTRRFTTPFGNMTAAIDAEGKLFRLLLDGEYDAAINHGTDVAASYRRCNTVVRQLHEYFRLERHEFDLPLAPRGTPFQQMVWAALQAIPYGATITYRELAERIGRPEAVRAVGRANATNPIPIIIPCHRVIGSDGTLTGYGGGLDMKERLLRLEGALKLQMRLDL